MITLAARSLGELVREHGGELRGVDRAAVIRALGTTHEAGAGVLAVLLHRRYLHALSASSIALIGRDVAGPDSRGWIHPEATRVMAALLDLADAPETPAVVAPDARIGPNVFLGPRVVIGARVVIAPGAVIGAPGFGHVAGRAIPQLGGVLIEDDVEIGALCTIASGTLAPTTLRRGVKLDAQVHVAHNCDIGEGTMIAAQTGLAGSVTIGKGVLIGGQVGIADHIVVGDGARIAAKSGVIGDVETGETVAGYPAVKRMKWLRGLASMYRNGKS